MHEIFEAVFHDFGTEFLDNERTEAASLLNDYLGIHFGLNEAAKDSYISTIFSIAEAVEWRKKEFNE
jgi:hypothetical protein